MWKNDRRGGKTGGEAGGKGGGAGKELRRGRGEEGGREGRKGEGKEGKNHPWAKARPFPSDSCSEGVHGSPNPSQPPPPHRLLSEASGL